MSRLGLSDLVFGLAALVAGVGAVGALLFIDSLDNLPETFRPDVIILAVKPQVMGDVAPAYAAPAAAPRAESVEERLDRLERMLERLLNERPR